MRIYIPCPHNGKPRKAFKVCLKCAVNNAPLSGVNFGGINIAKEGTVKTRYKFIHFGKMSDDPEVWICNNNRTGKALGYIEYYKPWRQMCFHPYAGTVFSDECHRDIAHFLGQLRK